ncbi:cAMP-dependent protein kinase inhibitor alpha-like [Seriola dumerili]|uniref:cAMP-dependent protein kinase inhibitor alpha-like n=1 Tax=Seriola dumerili TaxID=41447 RepID=UPI000BBEF717|nr:cAMP-dependent protein kinase inhibitor alpha-like [Seriola dumerili]
MTDVEATYEDFITSRRSGRRNAIHEIPATPGVQGPTDLSQSLGQLNINKSGDEEENAEKSQDSPAEEEETQATTQHFQGIQDSDWTPTFPTLLLHQHLHLSELGT